MLFMYSLNCYRKLNPDNNLKLQECWYVNVSNFLLGLLCAFVLPRFIIKTLFGLDFNNSNFSKIGNLLIMLMIYVMCVTIILFFTEAFLNIKKLREITHNHPVKDENKKENKGWFSEFILNVYSLIEKYSGIERKAIIKSIYIGVGVILGLLLLLLSHLKIEIKGAFNESNLGCLVFLLGVDVLCTFLDLIKPISTSIISINDRLDNLNQNKELSEINFNDQEDDIVNDPTLLEPVNEEENKINLDTLEDNQKIEEEKNEEIKKEDKEDSTPLQEDHQEDQQDLSH